MLDAYAAGQDGQARLTLLSTWLGHVHPASTYWYLSASPELLALAGQRLEARTWHGRSAMSALAPTLQAFFTDRLIRQRHASPHTIAAYRDTCGCCSASPPTRTGDRPRQLDLDDLDAPLIGAFLDHLEHDRGNSVRTRNARLAAIHSLFRYAALSHPEHAATHRPRPGDPAQTLRPGADQLPHRTRGRRAARPPATGPPGPADATTPCCCSPSRPGCGSPN